MYCFLKLGMKPSEFNALSKPDLTMIIAMIDIKTEEEAKQQKELERKRKK